MTTTITTYRVRGCSDVPLTTNPDEAERLSREGYRVIGITQEVPE